MKKTLVMALALTLTVAFAGCGNATDNNTNNNETTPATTESTVAESTVEDTTDATDDAETTPADDAVSIRIFQQIQDIHDIDTVSTDKLNIKIHIYWYRYFRIWIVCLVFVIQIPALESFVFILIHHNSKVIPVKLRKCLQSGKGLCH